MIFDFDFIGKNGDLKELWNQAVHAAPTDENVLITGATGTGKDILAKQIHLHSRRSAKPFIKINCGAIPAPLIESELFGHEKEHFRELKRLNSAKLSLPIKEPCFLMKLVSCRLICSQGFFM